MSNQENKQASVDTAFLMQLSMQTTFEDSIDVFYEYDSYMYLIDWIQNQLVFPFDTNVKVETKELKEMILETYVTFPSFSLEKKRNYVIGLAIAKFTEKKVEAGHLCRNLQGRDAMLLLSYFPEALQNKETLLGMKEGLVMEKQEYQYRIAS